MAELYLSAIKSAGMIPIAGWAARVYGKSSDGLWILDKSALFVHESLKKGSGCVFSGAMKIHSSHPKKEQNTTRFNPVRFFPCVKGSNAIRERIAITYALSNTSRKSNENKLL